MTHSFDLVFHEPSRDRLPGPGISQIYVKTHSTDETGHILITPQCISMTELEAEVERLMMELEMIRKKGKLQFGKRKRKKS